MTCNAWNHPPECTCGWGGSGHMGRRWLGSDSHDSFGSEYWWVPPITHTYESYVNPNAFCPVCNASVFFYQSPTGGRVFFDELGPPWPKHPCTDSSSIPRHATPDRPALASRGRAKYKWQEDEWTPFFIEIVDRIDKFHLKIIGVFEGEKITIYIMLVRKKQMQSHQISTECIAHMRPVGGGEHQLSLVTTSGISRTFNAYISLMEAIKNRS